MGWGNKYARAQVNPSSPRAFATCDVCGINWNLYRLQWQFQFNGTGLYNKRLLVCPTCYDKPSAFLLTPIIPPDPKPVLNARPEPYSVDEEGPIQNFIAALTFEQLLAGSMLWGGDPLFWGDEELEWGEDSIRPIFLDLYSASPTQGGVSVLASLTGSSTRTDWSSYFGPFDNNATSNVDAITFTTDAPTSVFVWYVVAFNASTGGDILAYSALAVPQTVVMGNGCGFGVGDLTLFDTRLIETEMITESGLVMITEDGETMITEGY